VLSVEHDDVTLRALCVAAAQHCVWISIGSLAVKIDDTDDAVNNVAPGNGAVEIDGTDDATKDGALAKGDV
jgi:hypothetical protein